MQTTKLLISVCRRIATFVVRFLDSIVYTCILLKIIEGPQVKNEDRATSTNKDLKHFPKLFFFSLASSTNHFQLNLNHKTTMIKAQTHLPTKTRSFSCMGG